MTKAEANVLPKGFWKIGSQLKGRQTFVAVDNDRAQIWCENPRITTVRRFESKHPNIIPATLRGNSVRQVYYELTLFLRFKIGDDLHFVFCDNTRCAVDAAW